MVFLAAGAVGWGSVALTTMEPSDGAAINSAVEAPTPSSPSCFPTALCSSSLAILTHCSLSGSYSWAKAPIPGSLSPFLFSPCVSSRLIPISVPMSPSAVIPPPVLLFLHMPLLPPFLLPAPAPPRPQSPFQSPFSRFCLQLPPISFNFPSEFPRAAVTNYHKP